MQSEHDYCAEVAEHYNRATRYGDAMALFHEQLGGDCAAVEVQTPRGALVLTSEGIGLCAPDWLTNPDAAEYDVWFPFNADGITARTAAELLWIAARVYSKEG